MDALQIRGSFLVIKNTPRFVVVWAEGVGKSPVRHRAPFVDGDGFLEGLGGLLMVEAVNPNETSVEPDLGIFAGGGYRPMEASEVVVPRL